MTYKRILTIQDISCVGQCSTTVALPVLSALGHETCILPTMVLSTHTGGFGRPVVQRLDGRLLETAAHWRENGIFFDAILVGYLGSIPAVEAAGEILKTMLAPGGLAIVDPAMGDNGRLYAGFDGDYVAAVGRLCAQADILLPNRTEAELLGEKALAGRTLVLTGAVDSPGRTGILLRTREGERTYVHDRIGGGFHGTGDLFAAVFTGVLMQGKEAFDAARIAADFVKLCIENTVADPAHWYGVRFEPVLTKLAEMVK
ncbi:MAG: bifunctional hydroxymethylpyrimidine kinase/phosphomethylpyrimidine kinase [Eubacteriales bacterium]|nr:bifunctional hydroxymethylpyrimidine kinase/phosphomethylpyrimidine kinase [Eubacteriales bacterium]